MLVWMLVVHIIALLFWAAALLYLPPLIAAGRRAELMDSPRHQASLARFVCTHIATPAALAAIVSGTAVFLLGRIVEPWLIVKLSLVAALVVSHTLTALLILRTEDVGGEAVRPWCWLLGGLLCILMTAIVWTVLAKPEIEALPWTL